MTETVELRPCPFCGGEADIVYPEWASWASFVVIRCSRCNASISCDKTSDVIKKWNRRPDHFRDTTKKVPEGYVIVPVEPTEVHFIFPSELTNEIVDTWREVFSIIPKSEYSNAMDYAAMAYGALKRYARAKAASQQPIGVE